MALGPTSAREKQGPFKQESVRFDVQTKTAAEKLQARDNIGMRPSVIGSLISQIPYGAVGSHVLASCTTINVAENTDVPGSTLRPTGSFQSFWIFNTPQTYNGTNGSALVGMWRCMGRIWSYADGSTTNVSTATLFVRIE